VVNLLMEVPMGYKKFSSVETMILKNSKGDWEFTRGKYKGYTINEVVAEDIGYAAWAFRDRKAVEGIADEPYAILGDALERAGWRPNATS
jgi:hypothetical protein